MEILMLSGYMKRGVVLTACLLVGCASASLHVERDKDGNLMRCDMDYSGIGRSYDNLNAEVCGSGVGVAGAGVDPELKNAIPLYLVPQFVAPAASP